MNKREWKKRKDALKRKQYAGMVLDAYDRLEHQEKRETLERKSEVERDARKRL